MLGNYSPRIPADETYVHALGRAAYNFAYLESAVVWIGECLRDGFIDASYNMTAKQIANKLIGVAQKLDDHFICRARIINFSEAFVDLAETRNKILHGRPYTADGGVQQLTYRGRSGEVYWPIDDVIIAAEKFEDAAIEAGDLLNDGGLLKAREARLTNSEVGS